MWNVEWGKPPARGRVNVRTYERVNVPPARGRYEGGKVERCEGPVRPPTSV